MSSPTVILRPAPSSSMTQAEAVEAAKTEAQKAADVTYTLNHAFACLSTDTFISPLVGDLTMKYFDYKSNIGCDIPGHDHGEANVWRFLKNQFPSVKKFFAPRSGQAHQDHAHDLKHHDHTHHDHDHDHDHDHAKPHVHSAECNHDHGPKKSKGYALNYLIGEFVGDVLAVPVAIWLQRRAPKVMHTIRRVVEPVFRPLFKFGTDRAAASWAWQNGLFSFSPETKAKAAKMYEHEASHLPQAVTWTLASTGISMAMQKAVARLESKEMYETMTFPKILRGKINGSAASALILVAFRGLLPKKAEQMDQFTSQKLFLPATKKLGTLFGVTHAAAEQALAEKAETPVLSWSEKILASSRQSHSGKSV